MWRKTPRTEMFSDSDTKKVVLLDFETKKGDIRFIRWTRELVEMTFTEYSSKTCSLTGSPYMTKRERIHQQRFGSHNVGGSTSTRSRHVVTCPIISLSVLVTPGTNLHLLGSSVVINRSES